MKTLVLFDIDYTLFNTAHFKKSKLLEYRLYPEVLEVLKKLEKKVEIGILSEGKTEFQEAKLLKTLLKERFKEHLINIVENKEDSLKKLIEKYRIYNIILVDDKLTTLHSASLLKRDILSVWVKRGPYADTQEPIPGFKPSYTVKNLRELEKIIS